MKRLLVLGYTLIELLVVLLIFSLLAGLVVPRLKTMYDSLQIAYEREEVLAQLGSLNYLAFQNSREFKLTSYPQLTDEEEEESESANVTDKLLTTLPQLELPAGWQVQAEIPILFRASGACSGGSVELIYQEQRFRVQLLPPFCQPQR